MNYARQRRFFQYVRRHRKGVLLLGSFQRELSGSFREKGVDVLLSIELMRLAAEDHYDVGMVLSGDGDLGPAIESVQRLYSKRVEVALPNVAAYHLRNLADSYIEITEEMFRRVRI